MLEGNLEFMSLFQRYQKQKTENKNPTKLQDSHFLILKHIHSEALNNQNYMGGT